MHSPNPTHGQHDYDILGSTCTYKSLHTQQQLTPCSLTVAMATIAAKLLAVPIEVSNRMASPSAIQKSLSLSMGDTFVDQVLRFAMCKAFRNYAHVSISRQGRMSSLGSNSPLILSPPLFLEQPRRTSTKTRMAHPCQPSTPDVSKAWKDNKMMRKIMGRRIQGKDEVYDS